MPNDRSVINITDRLAKARAGPRRTGDDREDHAEQRQITSSPADVFPENIFALDPNTPEGVAILRLHSCLKDIESRDGTWPRDQVVELVRAWFASVGIDPEDHPADAYARMQLALDHQPGGRVSSRVYGVRIGTDHDAPELVIRNALQDLLTELGSGTGIDLVSYGRKVLARFE